jgi:acyl carrier protein
MKTPVLATFLIAILACGCGSGAPHPNVDRVRSEVAAILKRDASEIDVAKPLAEQGIDELDLIEIIMSLEEAFHIEIPDNALSSDGRFSKTLTVQKLAKIVSTQQKRK